MAEGDSRAAQLLDDVLRAVKSADYAALPRLYEALEHELAQPSGRPDGAALAVIRRKAEINARCLLAAQRGVRAARRRLTEIRAASGGLVIYDNKGRRSEVPNSTTLAQRL